MSHTEENDKQKQNALAESEQREIRAGAKRILGLGSGGTNLIAKNRRLRGKDEKECKRDEANLKEKNIENDEKANQLGSSNEESEQQQNETSDAVQKKRGPRKEKSLRILTQKLLDNVLKRKNSEGCITFRLEKLAEELQVSKRRVYDVVNVLEALHVMEKSTQGNYEWRGFKHLPSLLHKLRKDAIAEELAKKIDILQDKMARFESFNDDDKKTQPVAEKEEKKSKTKNDIGVSLPSNDGLKAGPSAKPEDKRNTLVHLSSDFLKVTLASPNDAFKRPVSIDVASTLLISADPGSEADQPPSRSRCRRLYDVANVLTAMGLVTKSHSQFGTKKIPFYTYCGPEPSETAEFNFEAHLKLLSSTEANDNAEAAITMQEDKKPLDLFQKKSDLGKRNGVSADSEQPTAKRLRTDEKEEETEDCTVESFAESEPDVSASDFSSPATSVEERVSVVRSQIQSPIGLNSEAASILLPSAASTNGVPRERQENGTEEHAFRPPEKHSNSASVTQGHLNVERAFQQNILPYAFAPTNTHTQQLINMQRFQAFQLMNLSSQTNTGGNDLFSLVTHMVDVTRTVRPPVRFLLLKTCLNFITWYVRNYEPPQQ